MACMNDRDKEFIKKYMVALSAHIKYDELVAKCRQPYPLENSEPFVLLTEVMVKNIENDFKNDIERNNAVWRKLTFRGPHAFTIIQGIILQLNSALFNKLFPSQVDAQFTSTSHHIDARKAKKYKSQYKLPDFIENKIPRSLRISNARRGTLLFTHYYDNINDATENENKELIIAMFERLNFDVVYCANQSYKEVTKEIEKFAEARCWVHFHIGPGTYGNLHFKDVVVNIINFIRHFQNTNEIFRDKPKFFILPINQPDLPESKTKTDAKQMENRMPTLSEILVFHLKYGNSTECTANLKTLFEIMAQHCADLVVQRIINLYLQKSVVENNHLPNMSEYGFSQEFFIVERN